MLFECKTGQWRRKRGLLIIGESKGTDDSAIWPICHGGKKNAAVAIYNCHNSIVPKCQAVATLWTRSWTKWGQWSGAKTWGESQRDRAKGQRDQRGRNYLNGIHSEKKNEKSGERGEVLWRQSAFSKEENEIDGDLKIRVESKEATYSLLLLFPDSHFDST